MQILKKEMKLTGWDIPKLSDALGVSTATISNWRTGKYKPTAKHVDQLRKLGFSETACLEPDKEVEV